MINFLPTDTDELVMSTSQINDSVPVVSKSRLLANTTCTAGYAAVNFYCSPNPLSKVFFAASYLFGVAEATPSGTALAILFTGIPLTSVIESFDARTFNRLGKYMLQMGNVAGGNITNTTDIANLIN